MPPTPFIKSFLIADSVIQDRATGKWSVVGIFEQIFAPTFPCIHPIVSIYVKLTDAIGRYRVRIEFRDADDKVVSDFKGLEIEVQDRLRGGEFGVTTHGLPLQKPGRHQFSLYLNEEFAASAPLDVIQLKPAPAPDAPS
jgi:hypothetical protein